MEDQKVSILYQDDDFVVVEKPINLLVHPYKKESNEKEHLMRIVKKQVGKYLYPIHRLDRPVSGIVIFGFSSEAIRELQQYWHHPETVKEYITLAKGKIEYAGEFNFNLQNEDKIAQKALTLYEPIEVFSTSTLLKVRIKTGRKHQIRRHFSRRCSNIIGDKKYGQGKLNRFFLEKYDLQRIFLHAHYLKIFHPIKKEWIEFKSPLPEELCDTLIKLRESE